MDEQGFADFLTALGEEFCAVLGPVIGWEKVVPQDAYELFLRAFGQDPSPRLLAALTASQIERLRAAWESYYETSISEQQVRDAIAGTLSRWPVDDAR